MEQNSKENRKGMGIWAAEELTGGFTPIPNVVLFDPTLSDGAKLTYMVLVATCHNDKRECWPSQKTLAEWRGKGLTVIKNHLRELSLDPHNDLS